MSIPPPGSLLNQSQYFEPVDNDGGRNGRNKRKTVCVYTHTHTYRYIYMYRERENMREGLVLHLVSRSSLMYTTLPYALVL